MNNTPDNYIIVNGRIIKMTLEVIAKHPEMMKDLI